MIISFNWSNISFPCRGTISHLFKICGLNKVAASHSHYSLDLLISPSYVFPLLFGNFNSAVSHGLLFMQTTSPGFLFLCPAKNIIWYLLSPDLLHLAWHQWLHSYTRQGLPFLTAEFYSIVPLFHSSYPHLSLQRHFLLLSHCILESKM